MGKNILAINNAFTPTLITFGSSEKILFSVRENPPKNFANNILFIINELFKALSLDISEIDAISVVNGPGSFTGTRVSIVEAKLMAYALSVPLIAINSLELIGSIVKNGTTLLSAGRGGFFMANFRNGKMIDKVECVTPNKIHAEKIYAINHIKKEMFEQKKIESVEVHAEEILKLSEEKLNLGDICSTPLSLKPVYLRSTDILFKKRKK